MGEVDYNPNETELQIGSKCIGCDKELNCRIYHGGLGEYGAYLICKDCQKKKFTFKYEGY